MILDSKFMLEVCYDGSCLKQRYDLKIVCGLSGCFVGSVDSYNCCWLVGSNVLSWLLALWAQVPAFHNAHHSGTDFSKFVHEDFPSPFGVTQEGWVLVSKSLTLFFEL
jgi:hypothetical protein